MIACSGGSDSVALLSLMQALGYECVAAHMNFSLRGEESDRDEAFVRQLCARWNIPLHVKRVDTKNYAQKQGLSIEMAARELRYAWFEQLCSELGLQAIVLGHHQNDDIETFFLNLLRGSGAKGLAGIPRKNGYLVRPLLCVTRQEILDYLAENQLDYVNDSSNFQSDYLRNKIRLQLLPLLEEIQPSAAASIHRSQALLRTADQDLTQLLAPALQRISEQGNCLLVAEASESLLYQWLSAYRFNAKEISRIWQQRFAPSGQLYQ
nr:tRNA lysidine(34) synthetase TilS [Bacteroidales bacterium]